MGGQLWRNYAAEAFRQAGSAWCLAMSQLDAAAYLGATDPVGRAGDDELRALATRWRARLLQKWGDRRISGSPPDLDGSGFARPVTPATLLEPSER